MALPRVRLSQAKSGPAEPGGPTPAGEGGQGVGSRVSRRRAGCGGARPGAVKEAGPVDHLDGREGPEPAQVGGVRRVGAAANSRTSRARR